MLGTADIQVHILPVGIGLAAHEFLVVVRIHVAQVVGAGAREAGHRTGFQRITLVGPVLGIGQRRFPALGLEIRDFGQLQRQVRLVHRGGDAVLIINRERLAPITLARENGIPQPEIGLATAQSLFFHIILGGFNGLLHIHAIQETGIAHLAFLGIKTLLADVAALDDGHDGQVEFAGKGIVAAVVGRNRHNGSRTVAGQHIFGNPDRDILARERIHGIRARENARHGMCLGDALPLRFLLHIGQVFVHLGLLCRRGEFFHPVAFRSQHHEGDTENRIDTGGEDGHIVGLGAIVHLEDDFGTL